MKIIANRYGTSFFFLFILFLTASFFIMPYGDDWGYLTEPRFYDNLNSLHLSPYYGKWRPLDRLWGALMGQIPYAYPALNHIVVVAGHFASGAFLFFIGRRFGFSVKTSFLPTFAFLLSGNTFATVFSVDSLNQSLSLTFGLLSVFSCLGNTGIRYAGYIGGGILSVCAKESGYFFFIIGPAMRFVLNCRNIKDIQNATFRTDFLPLLTGISLTVLYFSFTFGGDFIRNMKNTIHVSPSFLDPSYYNISFGMAALLGRVFPVDLPAVLLKPANFAVAAISVAGALPLFLILMYETLRLLIKGNLFVWLNTGIILVFAASHASVNAITEMNSYPCIFFMWCLFLPAFDAIAKHTKIYYMSLILFFIASGTSLVHKYILIRRGNKLAEITTGHISNQTTRLPDRVYIMLIDVESLGHDIYQPIPPIAAGSGQMMKSVWNRWKMKTDIDSYQVHSDGKELVQAKNIIKLPPAVADSLLYEITQKKLCEYDAVWHIRQSGKAIVTERPVPARP